MMHMYMYRFHGSKFVMYNGVVHVHMSGTILLGS